MDKIFSLLFLIIYFQINIVAQSPSCNGSENIKDSIGKPFIKEALFLREVGAWQNGKDLGLSYDRLLQYPYLIPYKDSANLFNNYEEGLFTFITNSSFEDTLKQRCIHFENALNLNKRFILIQPSDTLRQLIKFKRKGNYRKTKNLYFEYQVYKLKLNVIYIGKYCRKIPYSNIGKNQSLFTDSSLNVYVILDVLK